MTSKFFNKFHFSSEQNLLQDLIEEAISIYGIEVYYLPRNLINYDQLYETDDQSTYTRAIPIDVYLQSVDGFGPEQNIFTKFGLEIRDNITVSFSRRAFEEYIKPITNKPRPDEGDIIYFDMNKKCFQIKYVNNKEIFYELGKLPTYQMTCELFEYSDETFNTGIEEIDMIQNNLSLNILDNTIDTENNNVLTTESGAQILINKFNLQNIDPVVDDNYLNTETGSFIDSSVFNPIGEITSNASTINVGNNVFAEVWTDGTYLYVKNNNTTKRIALSSF